MTFTDRQSAGKSLAATLSEYTNQEKIIILGLMRGGVPVAAEVARALNAPLDVMLVRKLGAPGNPELALGALAEGGTEVLNKDTAHLANQVYLDKERVLQQKQMQKYRKTLETRPMPSLEGMTVIVVDDGIATGASIRAAIKASRERGAKKVVVAVPVAPATLIDELASQADEIKVLHAPSFFIGVGQFYKNFAQVSSEEVTKMLAQQ